LIEPWKTNGIFRPNCAHPHGISLAQTLGQRKRLHHKQSTKWRKTMLTLMPSMTAGFVSALVTAVALAADWYIWDFRRRISPHRAAELASTARGKEVIHLPSASGREVVVIPAQQSFDQTPIPAVQGQNYRPELRTQC
jgi:hypothetical protein